MCDRTTRRPQSMTFFLGPHWWLGGLNLLEVEKRLLTLLQQSSHSAQQLSASNPVEAVAASASQHLLLCTFLDCDPTIYPFLHMGHPVFVCEKEEKTRRRGCRGLKPWSIDGLEEIKPRGYTCTILTTTALGSLWYSDRRIIFQLLRLTYIYTY